MKTHRSRIGEHWIAIAAFLGTAVLSLGMPAHAAPYYDWKNPYTGTEAHTLALWNFNEGAAATDSSGNGRTLTYVSPAVAQDGGKFGWGLNVPLSSSSTSYVQAASSTNLFPTGADPSLSIEMWVKFNQTNPTTPVMTLLDKQYSDKAGYQVRYQGGGSRNLQFIVGNGSSTMTMTVTAPDFQAGQWYHLGFTFNGATDTGKVFIDGVEKASLTSGTPFAIGNNPSRLLRIGNRLGSSYGSFDGVIDGVRISDVAYEFAVPEPASVSLLSVGVAAACGRWARR